jgi:hypothetical protein
VSFIAFKAETNGRLDIVAFVLSLAIAALRKPLLVLKVALPYITLLVTFAGFVAWNGSVVLGKRNSTSPYEQRADMERGQICSYSYYPPSTDALRLAVHCLLLSATTDWAPTETCCSAFTKTSPGYVP